MKSKMKLKPILILFLALSTQSAYAADDLDVLNLEDVYKDQGTPVESAPSIPPAETPTVDTPTSTEAPVVTEEKPSQQPRVEDIKVKELKDLTRLVPFSEISVIQKKYMPKTGRFQFFGALSLATNTPWYQNYGGKVNLGYNFNEAFGVELATMFLTSSARGIVQEIRDNNNVQAEQFIYTKGYYGLHLNWSPVYGKISYDDKKIINYEMYFAIGGGQSNTNSKEKNVTTLHIGLGQIFSITKSVAFRWDYGFNMFEATPTVTDANGRTEKNTYNDLVLSAGVSFFFPEANYR